MIGKTGDLRQARSSVILARHVVSGGE